MEKAPSLLIVLETMKQVGSMLACPPKATIISAICTTRSLPRFWGLPHSTWVSIHHNSRRTSKCNWQHLHLTVSINSTISMRSQLDHSSRRCNTNFSRKIQKVHTQCHLRTRNKRLNRKRAKRIRIRTKVNQSKPSLTRQCPQIKT